MKEPSVQCKHLLILSEWLTVVQWRAKISRDRIRNNSYVIRITSLTANDAKIQEHRKYSRQNIQLSLNTKTVHLSQQNQFIFSQVIYDVAQLLNNCCAEYLQNGHLGNRMPARSGTWCHVKVRGILFVQGLSRLFLVRRNVHFRTLLADLVSTGTCAISWDGLTPHTPFSVTF